MRSRWRISSSLDVNYNKDSEQTNTTTKFRSALNQFPIWPKKKPRHVIENVDNEFMKSRNVRVENKPPKDQMQKHTQLVQTAKEQCIQQRCAMQFSSSEVLG